MKLSKKQIDDLLTLVDHTRKDIGYGWGGTYGGYDESDKGAERESEKNIRKSERAIELIKQIIITRNV